MIAFHRQARESALLRFLVRSPFRRGRLNHGTLDGSIALDPDRRDVVPFAVRE
ncbi:hypothetical protein [Ancylobacter rudongensis]|uniref:Uncharacterized protein n=1 Tax=Ancylobacter rudongensis TaxID=177413 RepID=A0A1G4R9Q2_9HYPH|nr:hypothetical protein [Ancylobacter rudongensis]SCW52959.1 hypothetical protein SAMN05660859_1448 [Ancylobacter rudongensis]